MSRVSTKLVVVLDGATVALMLEVLGVLEVLGTVVGGTVEDTTDTVPVYDKVLAETPSWATHETSESATTPDITRFGNRNMNLLSTSTSSHPDKRTFRSEVNSYDQPDGGL